MLTSYRLRLYRIVDLSQPLLDSIQYNFKSRFAWYFLIDTIAIIIYLCYGGFFFKRSIIFWSQEAIAQNEEKSKWYIDWHIYSFNLKLRSGTKVTWRIRSQRSLKSWFLPIIKDYKGSQEDQCPLANKQTSNSVIDSLYSRKEPPVFTKTKNWRKIKGTNL